LNRVVRELTGGGSLEKKRGCEKLRREEYLCGGAWRENFVSEGDSALGSKREKVFEASEKVGFCSILRDVSAKRRVPKG